MTDQQTGMRSHSEVTFSITDFTDLEEARQVHNDAVADEGLSAGPNDPAGQQVEVVGLDAQVHSSPHI